MKYWALILAGVLPAQAELGLMDASNLDAPLPARAVRPAAPVKPGKPAAPVATTPASDPTKGLVRFRNGDSLHGELVLIDEAGQIEWRHPEAEQPVRFASQNVMQVSLAGTRRSEAGADLAIVALTNGDALRGVVKSLDDATLTLETWYAGTMHIKRPMIRHITPLLRGEAIIMDGFGSLADWRRSGHPEAWQLRNGVLVAQQNGSIGRDAGLPEQSSVMFDLSWQQAPIWVQVGLYTQRPEDTWGGESPGGYWLILTGSNAQVLRATRTEQTQLGQVDIRRFLRNGKIRVMLQTDKAKKTIALSIDGQLVKAWSDVGDPAGDGRCLTFHSQSVGEQNLRISNLLIREWSGDAETNAVIVTGQQDGLRLANQDRVTGTITAIKAGAVEIDSAVARLVIPLERVAEIVFAGEKLERARRLAGDVIAAFHAGGRVTVALQNVTAKTLMGTSENFGNLSFARDAFCEIQLHIYDEDRGDEINLDQGAIPQWSPRRQPFVAP